MDQETQKLNTTGLDCPEQIRKAIKDLGKLQANFQDMENGRKAMPPKGDNPPPPPPAAGAKRKTRGPRSEEEEAGPVQAADLPCWCRP